jgi:Histidine kinase-, DNA gyrase B-, and HSP90-like ATPase
MAALSIVKFDSGFSEIIRGSLFDCPAEFFSMQQMSFYQACKAGWHRCPLGYSTFAAFDAMGRKFVVPGNIVSGDKPPNRKFPNWQIRFEKIQIENFLRPHLGVSESVKEQRDTEFKNLTHDLRAISSEIYHTALTANSTAEDANETDLAESIRAIMNAQQMMSLRLDIVDYESGHSAGRPKENIAVYKKTMKVLHCFANRMNHRHVKYRIEGKQFNLVYGPPIFEIVPFVIVENAVKYAPSGSEIIIRFEENDDEIVARFDSLGPRIRDSEKSKIFEQHFRGDAARNSERSGSGIGLYAAKTLVESHFGGRIYVNQEIQPIIVNLVEYFNTRFSVFLPVSSVSRRMPGLALANRRNLIQRRRE